jgi:tRNA G18 (ribose-2'-O)-methylase SpoU
MGTALHLPWARVDDAAVAIETLEKAGYTLHALTPARGDALEHVRFGTRSAFLFGEEAHGLPPEIIGRCVPVRIPMAAGTDSLNVAATSAIVFDAIRRALGPAN